MPGSAGYSARDPKSGFMIISGIAGVLVLYPHRRRRAAASATKKRIRLDLHLHQCDG